MLSETNGLVLYPVGGLIRSRMPFILIWRAPLSRWAPLFVVIICAIPANYLLAEAVKRLPAATVYATLQELGLQERQ
jgi:multidrug transporter EmrE-like cation transporter